MLGIVVISAFVIAHVSCTDCPKGWVAGDGACYLFPRGHASTFTEAEHYCTQHSDAHLLEVESPAENQFIKDILRGLRSESHWLALTDEKTEGSWEWLVSGTLPPFFDWGFGEPNNIANEDCVVFYNVYNFAWADAHCNIPAEPICKIKKEYWPMDMRYVDY